MFPIRNNLINYIPNFNNINFQSIRYRLKYKRKEPLRKPVWQPIAPSKLYRIKKKEELSKEEEEQREHLNYTYEVNIKSIREFLHKEFYLPTLESAEGGTVNPAEKQTHEENFKKALEANQKENEQIARRREARLEQFRKDLDAKMMMMKIKREEDERRMGEEFDELVKQEIERSKTYITPENIDQKIEEALTHQTNYDYALDTNGRIYFDGSLHPYALKPKAVPDTSSNTEEYKNYDKSKPLYLKAKKLY